MDLEDFGQLALLFWWNIYGKTKRILSKEQPKSYLFRQKMERQLYTSWVGNISIVKSLTFQETWNPEEKKEFLFKL